MKQTTDNGVDFEMQELERLQYENLRKKYLRTANNGYQYWDYYAMTPDEQKLKDAVQNAKYPTILVEESEFDRFKRSKEWKKSQTQRQNDYNYLNGK
jgi:hypothetical protein